MLTHKTSKLFKWLVMYGSILGAIPYTFCPSNNKLQCTPWHKRLFIFNIMYNACYAVYLITVIFNEYVSPSPDLSVLPVVFSTLVVVVCSLIISVNLACNADNVKEFVNSYIKYCMDFESKINGYL